MKFARLEIAKLKGDVSASSTLGDAKVCPKFEAELRLFQKFSSQFPLTASLVTVPTEVVYGFNHLPVAYQAGTDVLVGQLIDETWVIVDGSGGGFVASGDNMVIFEIVGPYSPEIAESNNCEDKLRDAEGSYQAIVRHRPCGVSLVPEEDENGMIVVHDELGSFLGSREAFEVDGKTGVAIYMKPVDEDYNDCRWVITFIDWWREVQVIHDVLVRETEIRFKVKNVKVWDDCDLEDIVIPIADCEEEYYGQ